MGVIAVFPVGTSVVEVVRRTFRGSGAGAASRGPSRARVVSCRSVARAERLLTESLVEAILLDLRRESIEYAFRLADEFPEIPVFAFGSVRPDDGPLLTQCAAAGLRDVFVAGVDEPVIGELVAARSAASERRRLLADAPRLLGLRESLQLQAWSEILDRVDTPIKTTVLARALGVSREHLSREFAAGGAPNLKRVIDLARLACAAQLLRNPRYTVSDVARILNYSSPSHLSGNARRISGAKPSELGDLGPGGVLQRFRRGRTRSRL